MSKPLTPAQLCARRIRFYLAKHPNARWKELFEHVQNHYASMESMRDSLTTSYGYSLRKKVLTAHKRKLTDDEKRRIERERIHHILNDILEPGYLTSETDRSRRQEPHN